MKESRRRDLMNSIIKYLLLFMASIALMTVALVGVARSYSKEI